MNRYQKAIKYTKPSTEIDEKISRLNEMMTTTGMYTNIAQSDGVEVVAPEYNPPPLGNLGPDNFQWPDQGDGSDADANPVTTGLVVTDTLGREVPLYDYLPGITYSGWNRQPDYSLYPNGKPPMAILYDGRALASTRYFVLNEDGLNFVIQKGAYTTPGPYSDLQSEISEWIENGDKSNLTTKTVYIWGGLQVLLGQYYGASQYYPSDRDTESDPVAERGLYAYTMYVPGTSNPNYASDPGVRAQPPKVTNVISRDDLGDPNYYPGPVTNVSPEAINYLLSRIPPYVGRPPRNSPGPGPRNVQGPSTPIKYYPGMGFGPAGPVQPGGFYANSYEPEGEVLSEDLTKNDFARLNKYVKEHPEELEYAFKRYPASDPRLSKLNWKMDDMMRASNDYVDKQFPENIDRTSRVKKILARNIELSDPKTFKDPKQPMTYGKVFKSGTAKKYAKRNAVKKKANNLYTKTLAHTNMKRVKEMHEEKIKEEKIAQILREQQEIRAELAEIEAEESKYVNWRKELAEGMTTSGLGMINLPAEGDVDLESISSRVSPSGSTDGYSQSGSTYTFGPQSGEVNGSSLTMTIDAKKYDTLKFDFTAGTIDTLEVTTTSGDYILSATSGTKTITLRDSDKRSGLTVAFYVQRGDGKQSVGTNVIRNLAFQRRTPLNVLVPLDDPEANSFIRGGLGGDKERKAKLKDMLEAGNEYLSKYTNITPSQTTPGDIELAQLSPQTEKNIDAMLLKGLERGDYGSGPQIQKQIDSLKRNMRQGTPGGIPRV